MYAICSCIPMRILQKGRPRHTDINFDLKQAKKINVMLNNWLKLRNLYQINKSRPISSDDSLKFRDRICHSFLFFFCSRSAIWRCFLGKLAVASSFFLVFFLHQWHVLLLCFCVFHSKCIHLTVQWLPHFSHTPLNDERLIARIPFFLHACRFHLFCLNMVGRQGDQDLHPEVQLDVGCRFESHSSVGYWINTVFH